MMAKKTETISKSKPRSAVLMLVQQVQLLPNNPKRFLKSKCEILKRRYGLKKYAFILHDQDRSSKNNDLVVPHYHLVMQFDHRVDVAAVAKIFEQGIEHFEVMTKRGTSTKTAAKNSFAYLVHATDNSRDKVPYDPQKVTANFNFRKFLADSESELSTADILDGVAEGNITKDQAFDMLRAQGARILVHNKKSVETMAEEYQRKHHLEWLKKRNEDGKGIPAVWCFGQGGTGKTSYAKHFAEEHGLSYFITSGSNDPFQGYQGEEVLIIDELRPDVLPYSDLLQLLDPFNFEKRLKARYFNPFFSSDFIFVCTVMGPIEFYNSMAIAHKNIDTFEQLRRRLAMVLLFDHHKIAQVVPDFRNGQWYYAPTDYKANPFANQGHVNLLSMRMLDELGKEQGTLLKGDKESKNTK